MHDRRNSAWKRLSLPARLNSIIASILLATMAAFVALDYANEREALLRARAEQLATIGASTARTLRDRLSEITAEELDECRRTKAFVLEKAQRSLQNRALRCRTPGLVERITVAKRKEKGSGWTNPLRHFPQQLEGDRGDTLSFQLRGRPDPRSGCTSVRRVPAARHRPRRPEGAAPPRAPCA